MRVPIVLLLLMILGAGPAGAVEPGEMLADPALETRARQISKELRCLVCQNQSIDDSNAGLARDLRLLVRERLVAGDSDDEVLRHIVDRYGTFVLLRPPLRPATVILWFGPALLAIAAGAALFVAHRRRRRVGAPPAVALSDAERAELAALLDERGGP